MKDSKIRTEGLIDRYLSGNTTLDETSELEVLYFKVAFKIQPPHISETEAAEINHIGKESWAQLISEIRKDDRKPLKVKLWFKLAIASAVAAVVFGAGLFYFTSTFRHIGSDSVLHYTNDIIPGRNKATLTFANGKAISLSEAKTGVVIGSSELKYNDGTEIFSLLPERVADKIQILTASTPRGGTYQVILPDGTRVWLNADSKLSFPSQFTDKERKVRLIGEAYFVVKHNNKQPFRVESNGQLVEDIGTEFNINAYENEGGVKTTLIEGSASVSSLREPGSSLMGEKTILTPNQQATVDANSQISVSKIDPTTVIAWKNGIFDFENETLGELMRRVARWYDVEVIYSSNDLASLEFTGTISRYDNVSKLLDILEATNSVHFKIEGKKIKITR